MQEESAFFANIWYFFDRMLLTVCYFAAKLRQRIIPYTQFTHQNPY